MKEYVIPVMYHVSLYFNYWTEKKKGVFNFSTVVYLGSSKTCFIH